jgi:hypothetical protein
LRTVYAIHPKSAGISDVLSPMLFYPAHIHQKRLVIDIPCFFILNVGSTSTLSSIYVVLLCHELPEQVYKYSWRTPKSLDGTAGTLISCHTMLFHELEDLHCILFLLIVGTLLVASELAPNMTSKVTTLMGTVTTAVIAASVSSKAANAFSFFAFSSFLPLWCCQLDRELHRGGGSGQKACI